jgi:putative addiction module component (TIGR02574 family)
MRLEEIKEEIAKLGLAEKLLLVEDVWDSIAEGNAQLPMPEWQKMELDKRYRAYQEGRLALHGWKAVHEELRNKLK